MKAVPPPLQAAAPGCLSKLLLRVSILVPCVPSPVFLAPVPSAVALGCPRARRHPQRGWHSRGVGPRGDTKGGGGTCRGAVEGQGQSWDALGLCWDDLGLCWELKGQFRVVLGQLGQG